MTLILTLVTHDFVIQSSDRRLTLDSGAVFEDEANKALIYDDSLLISYTGLATVANQSTSDWLLSQAESTTGQSDLYTLLPQSANKAFGVGSRSVGVSPRLWQQVRRTSFVIAGYAHLTGAGAPASLNADQLTPIVISISNAERQDGAWTALAATKFKVQGTYLNLPNEILLRSSGQPLHVKERHQLKRAVQKCLSRADNPEPVARILARQIRSVAERNHLVGRSVMTIVLPRSNDETQVSGDSQQLAIWGRGFPLAGTIEEIALFRSLRPKKRGIIYIYYPGSPAERTHYGPNWILPGEGGFVMHGIYSGPT